MEINMELLIKLVKEREVLWDKTREEYKNKRLTFEAWREICTILKKDFETLTDGQKNEFGNLIMKKWADIQDNWVKCHRKLLKYKSEAEAKEIRKYYDHMQFLAKIIDDPPTVEGNRNTSTEEKYETDKNENGNPKKKRKIETNQVLAKILLLDAMKKEEYNNRSMNFFQSIVPSVSLLNNDEILEFQFNVVKTLRDINNRRRAFIHAESERYFQSCKQRYFPASASSSGCSAFHYPSCYTDSPVIPSGNNKSSSGKTENTQQPNEDNTTKLPSVAPMTSERPNSQSSTHSTGQHSQNGSEYVASPASTVEVTDSP